MRVTATCNDDVGLTTVLREHSVSKNVFSYLRTLKTWHCPHLLLRAVLRPRAAAAPAVQQSIDTSRRPGPQQQTRRTLLHQANGTDGRTDTVPFHRPCSAYMPHNKRAVPISFFYLL